MNWNSWLMPFVTLNTMSDIKQAIEGNYKRGLFPSLFYTF